MGVHNMASYCGLDNTSCRRSWASKWEVDRCSGCQSMKECYLCIIFEFHLRKSFPAVNSAEVHRLRFPN